MRKIIILTLLLTIFILACEKPIGGERDEYGCLGTAGYTYNENVDACIREWELNENQKVAAKIAVEYVDKKGLTITKVLTARCPGCFVVELEKDDLRININLDNWQIVSAPPEEKSMSPEECIAKGGRTVNIVGGDVCNEDETNIGEVKGFISPNICCIPGKVKLTQEQAIEIAKKSECTEKGIITENIMYNNVSQTWWIDLDLEKEYCNPACVVYEKDKTAEINWRCTGVIS